MKFLLIFNKLNLSLKNLPIILMFFQCSTVPEYLGKSLEDLNSNIKGNKSKGFPTSAMAIFVNPDIKNVVKDDEKRNDFVKAIRAAISEEKSDFIEVAVDDLDDLKNYKLCSYI